MSKFSQGRFASPAFPSASRDGFYFDLNVPPIEPPVFDQRQLLGKTLLALHQSGQLSGSPAGETTSDASSRPSDAGDFGFSTKPNPGEVLLRMEAARKRLAPTSTLSEFAMRAKADSGAGASADSSVAEFLIRLGRAQEQAAAGERAEAGAFNVRADGKAGVGAGPQPSKATLRFAALDDLLTPIDGLQAPSIQSPAATPVSSNGRLPNSGTKNWPRVPGSYDPTTDTLPRRRDDLHVVDRLDKGIRYYLGPHLYQGVSNVLETLPNVAVPRDVGNAISETGQAIADRNARGVVRGIGNIGLSALGGGAAVPILNDIAPPSQATRR